MATKKSTKSAGGAAKTAGGTTAGGVKEKSASELVTALAEATGLTKAKAKEVMDAHAALLVSELQSAGSVQLPGIGKLKVGERGERQGRNPATGEAITIAASKTVKFSAGKSLKDSMK